MKAKSAIVLGIMMMVGTSAFAQENSKGEVSLDFSYVHFVPQNNRIVNSANLYGGGGAGVYYFLGGLGIKGEFEGYGSTTKTFVFPAGSVVCPAGCTATASGNLFTYNVGPQIKFHRGPIEPFVEALFGGAHSNFYGNVFRNCIGCVISKSPSNNAFDFIIGGGIDIKISPHLSVRPVEFNYLLTRFGNNFTQGNNNQSNFRYQAGAVFRF
jgi:Outer membrane protein beta-barrel domain